MGSTSDWPTMERAVAVLEEFDVVHEARVLSAHRMPDEMFAYAEVAAGRGLRAIIAGAGGAAHLPGMLAAKTTVPVLGVPSRSRANTSTHRMSHCIASVEHGRSPWSQWVRRGWVSV